MNREISWKGDRGDSTDNIKDPEVMKALNAMPRSLSWGDVNFVLKNNILAKG